MKHPELAVVTYIRLSYSIELVTNTKSCHFIMGNHDFVGPISCGQATRLAKTTCRWCSRALCILPINSGLLFVAYPIHLYSSSNTT